MDNIVIYILCAIGVVAFLVAGYFLVDVFTGKATQEGLGGGHGGGGHGGGGRGWHGGGGWRGRGGWGRGWRGPGWGWGWSGGYNWPYYAGYVATTYDDDTCARLAATTDNKDPDFIAKCKATI